MNIDSIMLIAVGVSLLQVDAVLNQKFRAAREQGVSMTFRVGGMGGLRLDGTYICLITENKIWLFHLNEKLKFKYSMLKMMVPVPIWLRSFAQKGLTSQHIKISV